MRPVMLAVAGPPGSGKSSIFPVAETGFDYFNVDDAAAVLNGGSYRHIPPAMRAQANRQCEEFIARHIQNQKSFAVETTLRTGVTFEQAAQARANGFIVRMRFVALESVEQNIERIAARAEAGGHSAAEATIRETHRASLKNLVRAIREMDSLLAYDNTAFAREPRRVFQAREGAGGVYLSRVPLASRDVEGNGVRGGPPELADVRAAGTSPNRDGAEAMKRIVLYSDS